MSNKKSSDSGSSLKSIEEVIGNIRDNVVPSKNLKRNLPFIFKEPIPLDGFMEKGPFIIPRDKEGNIIPFEQPDRKPFIIPRDKDGNRIPIDPDKFIQLLSDEKKEQKEKFMINGMPTTKEGFDMFENYQKLNEKGQTMFQIFTEKNPDVNPQTILDILMGKPEFLSNQKTLSDLLDERAQSNADGGIVQLFGNM